MLPLNGDCPKSPISLDKSEDLRKTLSNPIVWGKLREGVQQTDLPSIKGFRALDVNITTNKSIYTWKGGAYLISNFENKLTWQIGGTKVIFYHWRTFGRRIDINENKIFCFLKIPWIPNRVYVAIQWQCTLLICTIMNS